MRLALAQLNPLVGDLLGNAEKILAAAREAERQNASLLLTPELSLWGYPPRDLLLQPALLAAQTDALDELLAEGGYQSLESLPVIPARLHAVRG